MCTLSPARSRRPLHLRRIKKKSVHCDRRFQVTVGGRDICEPDHPWTLDEDVWQPRRIRAILPLSKLCIPSCWDRAWIRLVGMVGVCRGGGRGGVVFLVRTLFSGWWWEVGRECSGWGRGCGFYRGGLVISIITIDRVIDRYYSSSLTFISMKFILYYTEFQILWVPGGCPGSGVGRLKMIGWEYLQFSFDVFWMNKHYVYSTCQLYKLL